MTTALGVIAALGMVFFSIAFLVDWLESYEAVRKYWKYGIWVGLIVEGSGLLIVAATPSSWEPTLFIGLIGVPISFLKYVGVTMLGMYYLAVLGYPSFPVILQKFRVASGESNTDQDIVDNKANTRAEATDSIQPANPVLRDSPEQAYV